MRAEEFKELLPKICDKDTTLDPDGWTRKNPLWGHCAVVSVLAQRLFGGELLRASLEGTDFAHMRSHYWNRLFGDTVEDFTANQFGNNYPLGLGPKAETRTVEYVLSNPETKKRYELLLERFESVK
ncbi:MAG: hypothetical protein WDZ40_02920 [Candidatus Spechtbacterales bacterium]